MEPQLERESLAGRPLVEVEADAPGSLRHLREARVDPAREPPLERRVARPGREVRLGRAERIEECVERGRTAEP